MTPFTHAQFLDLLASINKTVTPVATETKPLSCKCCTMPPQPCSNGTFRPRAQA